MDNQQEQVLDSSREQKHYFHPQYTFNTCMPQGDLWVTTKPLSVCPAAKAILLTLHSNRQTTIPSG